MNAKQNIARFSDFLNEYLSTNTDRKVQSNVKKTSAHVRLPGLEILKFSGEPTRWQTLYETEINKI